MKEGWTYKKLGEIADIKGGKRLPKGVKLLTTPTKHPYIRVADFNDFGTIDTDDIHYISDSVFEQIKRYIINKEDIYISIAGTIGKSGIIPDFLDGANLTENACRLILSNNVYQRYVYYFTISPSFIKQIDERTKKSAQPKLALTRLSDVIISYPTIKEQQSIVDYLDSAFAKIDAMKANAEKALNEAKALFQASLKEMLEPKEGIKWSTIGDLFETYSGGTPTKSNKEYYEGGSIPWLRSGEVCQKEITETEMFITEKGLKESSAKYYPENTVVVAMYGATAAQVGILRIKSTSNQAVCGILPHKDFLPEFVYYWFSSIENKLAAQAQGGAQPNISQQKIKKVEIPLYSIIKQQSIVNTLDSIKSKVDRLQENFDKISQECDALKQAILRQVFE